MREMLICHNGNLYSFLQKVLFRYYVSYKDTEKNCTDILNIFTKNRYEQP